MTQTMHGIQVMYHRHPLHTYDPDWQETIYDSQFVADCFDSGACGVTLEAFLGVLPQVSQLVHLLSQRDNKEEAELRQILAYMLEVGERASARVVDQDKVVADIEAACESLEDAWGRLPASVECEEECMKLLEAIEDELLDVYVEDDEDEDEEEEDDNDEDDEEEEEEDENAEEVADVEDEECIEYKAHQDDDEDESADMGRAKLVCCFENAACDLTCMPCEEEKSRAKRDKAHHPHT